MAPAPGPAQPITPAGAAHLLPAAAEAAGRRPPSHCSTGWVWRVGKCGRRRREAREEEREEEEEEEEEARPGQLPIDRGLQGFAGALQSPAHINCLDHIGKFVMVVGEIWTNLKEKKNS